MKCLSNVLPTNGQAATATTYGAVHLDGRALNRLLRQSTASQKAVIADDLHTGRLEVGPLTGRQARLLSGASYGYACTASTLSDAERAAVKLGELGLSVMHTKPKSSAFAAMARAANEVEAELGQFESISVGDFVDRVTAKMAESDRTSLHEALDRLAARYPNQMMAALDRVTRPSNGNGHANDNDNKLAGQMMFAL